jgi:hypothetical protein
MIIAFLLYCLLVAEFQGKIEKQTESSVG